MIIRHIENPFESRNFTNVIVPQGIRSYSALTEYLNVENLVVFEDGLQVEEWKDAEFSDDSNILIATIAEGDDGKAILGVVLGLALVYFTGGLAAGAYSTAGGLFAAGSTSALLASATLTIAGNMIIAKLTEQTPLAQIQSDSVKSIAGSGNQQRYGGYMPILCGAGVFNPDLVAKPYTTYRGNGKDPAAEGTQLLHLIYSMGPNGYGGVGPTIFNDIKIDNRSINDDAGIVFEWSDAAGDQQLVPADVDYQQGRQLTSDNDSITFKTSENVVSLEVDFTLVAYRTEKKTHAYIYLSIVYRKIDDNGSPTGEWKRAPIGYTLKEIEDAEHTQNVVPDTPKDYWAHARALGEYTKLLQFPEGDPIYDRGHKQTETAPVGTFWFQSNNGTPNRFTGRWDVDPGKYEVRCTSLVNVDPDTDSTWKLQMSVDGFKGYSLDAGDFFQQKRLAMVVPSGTEYNGNFGKMSLNYKALAKTIDDQNLIVYRESANPADWFIHFVLGNDHSGLNLPNQMVDFESLKRWRTYCTAKNLEFNRVYDRQMEVAQVLKEIADVGRARISFHLGRLTVIFGQEEQLPKMTFTLDHQESSSPLTISSTKKQDVTGIQLGYSDSEKDGELLNIEIGTAPFQRISIPGITHRDQAWEEINLAWNEIQKGFRIFNFSTNNVGLAFARGDIINVEGSPGLWSGAKKARILSIDVEDNKLSFKCRLEFDEYYAAPGPTPEYKFERPEKGQDFTAKAQNVICRPSIEKQNGANKDSKVFLNISWHNHKCSGQSITINDESGTVSHVDVDRGTSTQQEVSYTTQTFGIVLKPKNITEDATKSESVSTICHVDVEELENEFYENEEELDKIRGLKLIHTDKRSKSKHEFAGKNVTVGWAELKTGDGNNNLKGYLVKIYSTACEGLLRSVEVKDVRFQYTFEMNMEDTDGFAQRHLTFTVQAITHDDKTSGDAAKLEVWNNRPGTPNFTVQNSLGMSELQLSGVQRDPDFEGYLVWQNNTSGFTPEGTEPGWGNCLKSVEGSSTITITADVVNHEPVYVRIAAYDAFDKDAFNYSDQVEVKPVKVTELGEFREEFDNLELGFNDITFPDGTSSLLHNGKSIYDFAPGSAFQQAVIAALGPASDGTYQAFHSDIITGDLILGKTIAAEHLQSNIIEAHHIASQSALVPFMGVMDLDVSRIYHGLYQYETDGNGVTTMKLGADGNPIRNSDAEPFVEFIDGRLDAKFDNLEVGGKTELQILNIVRGQVTQSHTQTYGPKHGFSTPGPNSSGAFNVALNNIGEYDGLSLNDSAVQPFTRNVMLTTTHTFRFGRNGGSMAPVVSQRFFLRVIKQDGTIEWPVTEWMEIINDSTWSGGGPNLDISSSYSMAGTISVPYDANNLVTDLRAYLEVQITPNTNNFAYSWFTWMGGNISAISFQA